MGYYDSDPTKVVQGLRDDKKKPMSLMADTTTANAQVRSLSETVRLDARTKLLNPKFYEGMLSTGYEGYGRSKSVFVTQWDGQLQLERSITLFLRMQTVFS